MCYNYMQSLEDPIHLHIFLFLKYEFLASLAQGCGHVVTSHQENVNRSDVCVSTCPSWEEVGEWWLGLPHPLSGSEWREVCRPEVRQDDKASLDA